MTGSEDTEITLGTGKMLAAFFGLVVLCAVFFGMGFRLGKNSANPAAAGELTPATNAGAPGLRPSAAKGSNASPASDQTSYKPVAQKDAESQPPANEGQSPASGVGAAPEGAAPAGDPNAAPSLNAYYVQVAAVSKQEDADALVEALKKKQYAAFAAGTSGDKLFHVQVGPFGDVKDAEAVRARLVSDGYNPILKK